LALELTLSRQEWKQVLSTCHGLPRELMAQIQSMIAQSGKIFMCPVDLSNIAAIGYDPAQQVLQVDFHHGGRYRYQGVPPHTFDEFQEAPSKGRFLNREIKACLTMSKFMKVHDAIELIEEDGLPIPEAVNHSDWVEVDFPVLAAR